MKIARFSDLNDPFELLAVHLGKQDQRAAFRRWKAQISQMYGVLCFSRSWKNPVLWSHYGEKHRGMCLGFDLPTEKIVPVRYQDRRIELDDVDMTEATVMQFLSTKFTDWHYEEEVRIITDLAEMDARDQNYYADFGTDLVLREVIVGALSGVSRDAVAAEIAKAELEPSKIDLRKARLAFKSFDVVADKRGLR